LTEIVHEPLAGIAPPVRVTAELPLGASTVPPHVVLALPETVIPAGNWSVSGAVSVSTTALLLLKVRTTVETEPKEVLEGLKDLPSVGATRTGAMDGVTVNVATAGDTLFPLLVCKEPEGSELM
jgi:hypothetical protein